MFLLLAFGDILRDPRDSDYVPILVGDRECPVAYPSHRAVGPYDAVLFNILPGHLPRLRSLQNPVTVIVMDCTRPGPRRRVEALATTAPYFLVCGADVEHFVLRWIGQPEYLFDVLGELTEALFAFQQVHFGAFALCDIPDIGAEERLVREPDRHHGELYGKLASVLSHRRNFDAFAQYRSLSGGVVMLEPPPMACVHAGRNDELGEILSQHFFARVAEGLLRCRVEFDHTAFCVDGDEAIERRFDNRALAQFAGPEGTFRVSSRTAFPLFLNRPLHGRRQAHEIRLHHIVDGTGLEGANGKFLADRSGNENERRVWAHFARQCERRLAVEARH